MKEILRDRSPESGSAGTKFMLTMAILVLAGNAGYNYVPVAYEAEAMRSDMGTAVLQGLATPGKMDPVDNVRSRVMRAAQVNNIPSDAIVDVKMAGTSVMAHVTYTKPVNILPFGIFKYNYKFDNTATPTGFLLKQ